MYKKTVTYKDFNDATVTEDLYFNLSKDNLVKLIEEQPNFAEDLQSAFDGKDGPSVFVGIRTLILKSYGIKSADGKSFSKKVNGVPLEDTFEDTAAYSAIMDEFLDNLDNGAEFFMGIFPQDLMAQARTEMEKNSNQLQLPGNDTVDDIPQELSVQTDTEVTPQTEETPDFATMTPVQFDEWRKNNT